MNKNYKFYLKLKMFINNGILYPLGITNTIIRVIEMKKVENIKK